MSFRYCIEPAKSGRSKCSDTKCKEIINKEELRIGKISKNPFNDEGEMTKWYHAACMFSAQTRMRGTSKKVESSADLENFEDLDDDQKATVEELVAGGGKKATKSKGTKRKKAESDEDEDDESEDEKPKKKAKAEKKVTAKAKAKSKAKKSKKEESDDDEGSADEDDAEEAGAGAGEVAYYESESSSGGKFWEVQRNGTKVTTRYGKVGANGQSNTKDWGTVDKAEKEVAKLVKEKTKKGYELAENESAEPKAKAKPKSEAKKSVAKKSKKEESDDEEGSADEGDAEEAGAGAGAAGEVAYYESESSSGGKFWEVQRNGTKVTTRYGKVGANGQSNTKDWGTVDKAEKEVAKLVREKTNKGYELATRD